MLSAKFAKIPRRVLMTADTVGGVWTYALELTRALSPYAVEVVLATMGAPLNDEQQRETRSIPNLKVFESIYKLEWMDEPWHDVQEAGEWLLDLEKQLRPEIVHLNGYAHAALPWHAPTLVVGHSCVISWWWAVKGEDAPAKWNRYRDEVTRALGAADCVVAPTRAMLSALEKHYGPLKSGCVVSNGRDSSLFQPGAKDEFILTAGRLWDEGKNVAALERIAPHLAWPVYVAGEEKHPDFNVRGQGRTNHVHTLGRLSHETLASWYSRAAIYALPARYEPFGLSVLEAALAGCALVLGDIPSLREVWGAAAVFVQPDDHGALRAALEELIASSARRKELAHRSRLRALYFTPERMAQGYLETYDALRTTGGPNIRDEQEVIAACAS